MRIQKGFDLTIVSALGYDQGHDLGAQVGKLLIPAVADGKTR
jgi:hypothetical protein